MDSIFIAKAEQELSRQDPVLGTLVRSQKLTLRSERGDYFTSLCRSIIGQQVSVAAAAAIFARLEIQTDMSPLRVASLNDEAVKIIGLSRQKAGYLRDLAQHFVGDPAIYNHLDQQSDEQVISELTDVKGIGVWTAQMFLIFTLNRPDVFAPDDGGLQRAMKQLYGWDVIPKKKELEAAASAWQPYRSVASLHLWHSLDNNPA